MLVLKAGENDLPTPALNAIRSAVIANKSSLLETLDLGIDLDQEPDLVASLTANKDRANKVKNRVVDRSWIDMGYRWESEAPSAQTFETILKADYPKFATVSSNHIRNDIDLIGSDYEYVLGSQWAVKPHGSLAFQFQTLFVLFAPLKPLPQPTHHPSAFICQPHQRYPLGCLLQ